MKPGSRCPTRNWRPYGLREIRSMANGITPSVPDHDGSSNCCPVPVFQRWGPPDRLRVDNGHPWGAPNDLPTGLALWLIGWGVKMIWNKPHCPQRNGVVERSQGVTQQWVEPQMLADSTQLQARLDWAVRIQRELSPAVAGQSRLAAFPALATPRRRYQIEIEDALRNLD